MGGRGTGTKCFSGWYTIVVLTPCKCTWVNTVTTGWFSRNCSLKELRERLHLLHTIMEQRAHRSELCDPPGHPRRFTAPCGKCPPVQPHRPRPGPAAAAQRGDAPLLAGGWGWRYGFCSDGADCSARLAAGFVNFIQFGPIAGGERLVQPGPLSPTPLSLARSFPPHPPLPARLALQISRSPARSLCIGNHSSYSQTELSLSHWLPWIFCLNVGRLQERTRVSFKSSGGVFLVVIFNPPPSPRPASWSLHSFGGANRVGFQKGEQEPCVNNPGCMI